MGVLRAKVGASWVDVVNGVDSNLAGLAHWNSAWGVIGVNEGANDITTPSAPLTLASVTFTAVAGRLYRAHYKCVGDMSALQAVIHVRLLIDGAGLADSRQTTPNVTSQVEVDLPCERFTASAGTHTVTASFQYPTANYFTVRGSFASWRLVVADVGPVIPASIAPPAAEPRVVASGNALGIVQMGSFLTPSPRSVAASVTTKLTNPLAFTMAVGRRYRLYFQLRAVTPSAATTQSGGSNVSFWLYDKGGDLRSHPYGADPYTYLEGNYQGVTYSWLFDGDGLSHSFEVVAGSTVNFTAYTDYGQFYLEDVGPNSAPALPIPATDPPWTPMVLGSPWINYGSGWQPAAYRKIGDIVSLRGLVRATAATPAGNPVTTLPVGFRPPASFLLGLWGVPASPTTSATYRVDVQSDGNVIGISTSGWDHLSLANIHFSITA